MNPIERYRKSIEQADFRNLRGNPRRNTTIAKLKYSMYLNIPKDEAIEILRQALEEGDGTHYSTSTLNGWYGFHEVQNQILLQKEEAIGAKEELQNQNTND